MEKLQRAGSEAPVYGCPAPWLVYPEQEAFLALVLVMPASLRSCSSGIRRWAWAIFKRPSSEMETLLLAVAKLAVGAQHDLQMPGQIFFAEKLGHRRNPLAFVGGNLQQGTVRSRDFGHCCIA